MNHSVLSVRERGEEMQSPRIPGRKRGRPPLHSNVLKMTVHNSYSGAVGSIPTVKIPKKRGRKPGFKYIRAPAPLFTLPDEGSIANSKRCYSLHALTINLQALHLQSLKSRVVMTPLAISPPRSTPEPDISSIPQDAATVPNSAIPQALTVCIYVNKQGNTGPYLDRKKVQQLPDHFGPERPSMVLQQAVQACIDCAHQQKSVFSLVKQGYGGEMVSDPSPYPDANAISLHADFRKGYRKCESSLKIRQSYHRGSGWMKNLEHLYNVYTVSASFEGKQHLLSLPVVNSIGYVLRFLKKLCRSLICDNLFSNQPFVQYSTTSDNPKEYDTGRMESETVIPEDYLVDPVNTKRYNVDPSDSAYNYMGSLYPARQNNGEGRLGGGSGGSSSSSCNHRSSQMSSGVQSSAGLRRQTSSPTRSGSYLEGNRSASSPSPENQETVRPSSKDPSSWTVEDVVRFVKDADPQALGPHVDLFRKHEIDGNALLLLRSDMVMKYLGLKLGPALKLCYHIDKLKQAKF